MNAQTLSERLPQLAIENRDDSISKPEILGLIDGLAIRDINAVIVILQEIASDHRKIAYRLGDIERILADDVRRRAEKLDG